MPEPRFSGRRLRASALALGVLLAMVATLFAPVTTRAANDKQLQRVKGQIGYQPTKDAPFTLVAGRYLLGDDELAVTHAKSAATLTLPDSSIVGLGENTSVQVGAFNQTTAGPGSTITVNNGTLRFDIRRPQGGTANYHFATNTTQIAVRGTIGLISLLGGNTTVACVVCAADSLSVSVGTQTFTLLSGQLLTVSAAGAVVTGAVTASVLGGFSAAGVSTSAASGAAAATAGVASSAAIAGTTAAVAGGAAAAAAAAAVVVSSQSTAKPQETPTPTPAPTGTASGSINLSGAQRPAAPAGPPVARPLAPPGSGGPSGRR